MVFNWTPVNGIKGVQLEKFGERLREERERLNLSQAAFGEIGGVLKRAQIHYEKGERIPDAGYLAAIAGVGVDTVYLLTGRRSDAASVPAISDLPPDEQLLLDTYRGLSVATKKKILADLLMDGVSQAAPRARRKAVSSNSGINVSGSGNRVAGRDYQEASKGDKP